MTQSDFHAALLDPERPAPHGLTDPEGRPAGRRFDVYRNNVAVSLTEALRQAFPVVRKLVGEAFFTAMAREHARRFPPRSPLLMFYGEDMPGFLAGFPPVAHLGYLPDIARLELALRQSYHAADAKPLAVETLQSLAPEAFLAARIRLAPALR
ncbi:MAG: DNA-binding domain-containing protein, partial [Albidovulum sp.]